MQLIVDTVLGEQTFDITAEKVCATLPNGDLYYSASQIPFVDHVDRLVGVIEDCLSPYQKYLLKVARHYKIKVQFDDDKVIGDFGNLLVILTFDKVYTLYPLERGMINIPAGTIGYVKSVDQDHYYVKFESGPDEIIAKCYPKEVGRCIN